MEKVPLYVMIRDYEVICIIDLVTCADDNISIT